MLISLSLAWIALKAMTGHGHTVVLRVPRVPRVLRVLRVTSLPLALLQVPLWVLES